MTKFIAFGLAAGVGVQSLRVFPPDAGPATVQSLALVFVVAVLCAFFGGRRRAPQAAIAVAQAEATAIATNQVNLAVVIPGAATAASAALPSWLDTAVSLPEVSEVSDDLGWAAALDRMEGVTET